jgi:hypothetical protein
MAEDFFLSSYVQLLEDKTREIMLDNYIELYNSFNIK